MKRIFIIGAGRSSPILIKYLEENSKIFGWEITAGDRDINLVKEKVSPPTRAITFDVFDENQLNAEVQAADIVVSMLPARFHPLVALTCLKYSNYVGILHLQSR